MKFIRLLLLIYLGSLSFVASSGDLEIPAPDNPKPLKPMPFPDKPVSVTRGEKESKKLQLYIEEMPSPDKPKMPFPDKPVSVTRGEKESKKLPLYINKNDLTSDEMNQLKKFGELELHREVQFFYKK